MKYKIGKDDTSCIYEGRQHIATFYGPYRLLLAQKACDLLNQHSSPMIKANELRLGNYLMSHYTRHSEKVTHALIAYFDNNLVGANEKFSAIPLTKDLLIKIGLKESEDFENTYFLPIINDEIIYNPKKDTFRYETDIANIPVTTLHDLQNTYFAINKKELKLDID